jgi:hypothetical protein
MHGRQPPRYLPASIVALFDAPIFELPDDRATSIIMKLPPRLPEAVGGALILSPALYLATQLENAEIKRDILFAFLGAKTVHARWLVLRQ